QSRRFRFREIGCRPARWLLPVSKRRFPDSVTVLASLTQSMFGK
ncbi:MAG: hypothetical protein ACI9JD_006335, partial [Rhodococcus sp. (in: high G+C Gram-positive bacteria)]